MVVLDGDYGVLYSKKFLEASQGAIATAEGWNINGSKVILNWINSHDTRSPGVSVRAFSSRSPRIAASPILSARLAVTLQIAIL